MLNADDDDTVTTIWFDVCLPAINDLWKIKNYYQRDPLIASCDSDFIDSLFKYNSFAKLSYSGLLSLYSSGQFNVNTDGKRQTMASFIKEQKLINYLVSNLTNSTFFSIFLTNKLI